MKFKLTYKPYGQHGVLVEWPASIDEETLHDVLCFKSKLNSDASQNIIEVRSAYHSLLIIYCQFKNIAKLSSLIIF